jgi:hypothetical protein
MVVLKPAHDFHWDIERKPFGNFFLQTQPFQLSENPDAQLMKPPRAGILYRFLSSVSIFYLIHGTYECCGLRSNGRSAHNSNSQGG